MIILGYTTKGKVLQTNSFICPKCAGRKYELTEYKRYFTIFFIPLFPLVKVGDAAVCSSCKSAFVPEGILGVAGYQSQIQTTTTRVADHKAPIIKRAFSWLVDTLLAAILTVIIENVANPGSAPEVFLYLLYSLGWFIYGIACDMALGGRTVGKMLFYIQVKQDDESELTIANIFVRNLVKASLIFFGLPILVLTTLIRDDRKSLHDLIAGTNVFERPSLDQ
jgi:uncharacterized RDD family membrane protein YckC